MNYKEKLQKINELYEAQQDPILGPSDLKKILINFTFTHDEIKEHLLFPEDLPYGRKCIYRTPNFEVIVMNWKPGRSSNIHDHGESFGCVYAVSGDAWNVLYDNDLNYIGKVLLQNNSIAEVPRGIFHQIENNSDDYAVSLHFYAPPLKGMKVIDLYDKTKSYIVNTDSGAWNPCCGSDDDKKK